MQCACAASSPNVDFHGGKVGSSFASFFMPGAPPRQGHSGSRLYVRLVTAICRVHG
ncbi:hypothetical protein JOM56_010640 [Amanita muscaria]